MEKSTSPNTIVRFKEDPIHSLILETLNKKPVNSDFYSVVKRIKLGDYTKKSVTTDNLDTVSKRAKDYMNEVGFAYGRLQEKNWGVDENRKGKLRIHAPGPVITKTPNEEIDENLEFNDTFHTKVLTGFQKIKPPIQRDSAIKYSKPRGKTTISTTRVSASQHQAREYLNYLHALNLNEQSFITSQVSQKKKELEEKFEEESKKEVLILNTRGIFSKEFNKERVKSMTPVKMQKQVKLSIEPMVRTAKDIVMKEKIKDWKFNPFSNIKIDVLQQKNEDKMEKLLDIVESTISKKSLKNKRREVSAVNMTKKKVKMHWVDRLNQTVNDVIGKIRPDEKIIDIKVI
ncbi:hypothetical protein SteCoe_29531 [Stentor coeruleus]|uniref:Uncharacterized protein n=1 Tax=Stentor coeruleus TaxID=5963 RepID=A0A1R2B5N6_9CILI|nr:hypothetical protein SteCoe_29531 [Stentor coeruleus]